MKKCGVQRPAGVTCCFFTNVIVAGEKGLRRQGGSGAPGPQCPAGDNSSTSSDGVGVGGMQAVLQRGECFLHTQGALAQP